jgi:2-polyprenyl-3-methyl-5-hydroxy-6-metoxy-1,4-benzoquinol methylase
MFGKITDREWEKFGKNDPYYGVLTLDKFRSVNLTDDNKEEFFRSGYEHIDIILKKIRTYIDSSYMVNQALDFGCGVGRLVIPLAEISNKVTGVDISESMLLEAKRNCEARSLGNVDFIKSNESLSLLEDRQYNFIHSIIVFQHIPTRRGELIFRSLISHLEDGGCGVIHFTYSKLDSKIRKIISDIFNKYIPFGANLINIIKGKSFFAPSMQMNKYNLNKLFLIMQESKISNFHTEFTNDNGELGIILYFQKG